VFIFDEKQQALLRGYSVSLLT